MNHRMELTIRTLIIVAEMQILKMQIARTQEMQILLRMQEMHRDQTQQLELMAQTHHQAM